MTPAHKKLFIVLLILAVLTIGYFLFGKNLIYPPRASEALTIYNIYSRGIDKSSADPNLLAMPTRTVRWKSLPVAVYSQEKIDYLPDLIKEWNQVMNREVFKIGGPDSAIVIKFDSQITPVGIVNIQYNHYLLEKAEIILNPNPNLFSSKEIYHNQDLLKSHLGRALGFFGYTTDDPNGVMDIDQTKHNTKISLLVVSVLDELYKLPLATHGQVDIKLMEAVKKYNIDSRPVDYEYQGLPPIAKPIMPTRTMRWRSLPVAVYDQDNLVPGLQNILKEWNQAMGQDVFIAGGPESPITIEENIYLKTPPYISLHWETEHYLFTKAVIRYNPQYINKDLLKHEFGHVLGFLGDTINDPKGIMDSNYQNLNNALISSLVSSVVKEIHQLPPGVLINY